VLQRFGKLRQILYANGMGGFSILDNIFGVYLIFFFLPPKESGLPELISNEPVILGLTAMGSIIIFGRIIDSISDPVIANWSDNSKAKMGRRKFFLITGSLPFTLFSILLFFPPYKTVCTINAFYIAIILGIYFFLYTYFMGPYLALIPELTHTHKDRINILVYQSIFALVGGGIVMVGVPQLWEHFQGTETFAKGSALQASLVIVAIIGFISMFISSLVIDEKRYTKGEPANVKLFESLKMTLKNRTYIIYMIPTILYWFSFNIVRTIAAYYPIVLLNKEEGFQTMLMGMLFGGAILSFGIISVLSRKVSNKAFMLCGLLLFSILMSFTYIIDMFGEYKVMFGLVHMALLGIPVAILLIIPTAILSDIAEVDGYKSGKQRQAMFFGTQGLFMKINYGLAAAIATYLFATYGKDAANPMGVKLAGPVAGVFCLVGFFIFLLYPQKEIGKELVEIREGK